MEESKSDDVGADRDEDQNKSTIEGREATHDGPIGADASLLDGQSSRSSDIPSGVNPKPPVASGENSSASRWPRRNFVVGAATVLATATLGGAGLYYTVRSDKRNERNEMRENERNVREFPVPVGVGIEIKEAVVGEYVPMWTTAFVSPELMHPQDFTYGAKRSEIFRSFFNRGGSWYGRVRVEITVESLRRAVLINGAHVKVRSLGSPPKETIFVPLPYGGGEGPGEETEIPRAGVNLDAPWPVVRVLDAAMFGPLETLEEQKNVKNNPLVLGDIFPGKQITLGPHDAKQITIIAEARTGYYEWELFFDIIADGERQVIPVKTTNGFPLRLAAPARGYRVALEEMYHPDNANDVFGGVRVIGMKELLGAIG